MAEQELHERGIRSLIKLLGGKRPAQIVRREVSEPSLLSSALQRGIDRLAADHLQRERSGASDGAEQRSLLSTAHAQPVIDRAASSWIIEKNGALSIPFSAHSEPVIALVIITELQPSSFISPETSTIEERDQAGIARASSATGAVARIEQEIDLGLQERASWPVARVAAHAAHIFDPVIIFCRHQAEMPAAPSDSAQS